MSGFAQTGNHVFSGSEAVNFGTIDLATPASKTWSTDRMANPGYFSAYFPGAVYTGASDANNVNGYVKKYGNEIFTFPVGTGNDLRTLAISAPAATTDAYATAWILGHPKYTPDPTNGNAVHDTALVGTGIKRVTNVGQWDWQSLGTTNSTLNVTASMPDLKNFAPIGHLRLVGWDGTKWINLSGVTAPTSNTENSLISGTIAAAQQSGIHAISIGSIAKGFPDLNPTIDIDLTNFPTSGSYRDFVVNVNEILGSPTDGQIVIRISKLSAFTITYDPNETISDVFGGTLVDNLNWSFSENSFFITCTSKPGITINSYSLRSLGFTVTRNANVPPNTPQTITATVVSGTGAESIAGNNAYSVTITAN